MDDDIVAVTGDGTIDRLLTEQYRRIREQAEWNARMQDARQPPERGVVSVTVASGEFYRTSRDADDDEGAPPENLKALIAWFGDLLERVPAEARDVAVIDFESEYESSSIEWTVKYGRPETDEEWAARLERRRETLEAAEAATREKEMAALARLKAKYEGK